MENESKVSVSNLQEIEHHLSEIKSKVSPEKDLPDEVDSLIAEASYILSMIAHKLDGMASEGLDKADPKGVSEEKYKSCKEQVASKQGGSKEKPYNVYAVCASALKKNLSPEKMALHESKDAIDIGHGWKLHPESKSRLMSSITHPEHGHHTLPLSGSNSHIAALVKEGAVVDAAKELAKQVTGSKALKKAKHCLAKSKKMKVFLGGGAGD
jgi:hypothetical protein